MSNDTPSIEIPADLEWEEPGAVTDFIPDTFLYTELEMWGIRFYVDAFAVDESGEALAPAGARVLKSVREIDDYELGALYETVELIPGRKFMIVLTPARALNSPC
jgi:hypothetical protein